MERGGEEERGRVGRRRRDKGEGEREGKKGVGGLKKRGGEKQKEKMDFNTYGFWLV